MTALLATNLKELTKALEKAWYESTSQDDFYLSLEPEEIDLLEVYFYIYSERNEALADFARRLAKGTFKPR